MRMLDEQPWKEQAKYRSLNYEEWRFQDGELVVGDNGVNSRRGGLWKGTDRLRLYTVDEAGHFAPYHQSEAIGAVLRSWLREF
jgi:cathepsin A (carboxypeptidase C)